MTDPNNETVETTVFPPTPEPAPEVEPVTEPVTTDAPAEAEAPAEPADPNSEAINAVSEGWKAWQQGIQPTDAQKAAAKSLRESGLLSEDPVWMK